MTDRIRYEMSVRRMGRRTQPDKGEIFHNFQFIYSFIRRRIFFNFSSPIRMGSHQFLAQTEQFSIRE